MGDFMADLNNRAGSVKKGTYHVNGQTIKVQNKGDNLNLDMTGFMQIMITQLTHQGIDDSMDTSQMLEQMVQMQMVTTMTNLTDASVMSYGASLVGKEVTVAKFGTDGKMQEFVGVVTGSGTMDGKQVIVIGDEYYYLNEILAVGKLPPPKKDEETDKPGEEGDAVDKGEGTQKPDGGTQKPDEGQDTTGKDGTVDKTEGTEAAGKTPGYNGQDGAPGASED